MQKNETLTLHCDRLGSELEGVCDAGGMPLFVPGALPGETVEALVVKAQPRYGFGRLMTTAVGPSAPPMIPTLSCSFSPSRMVEKSKFPPPTAPWWSWTPWTACVPRCAACGRA